MCTHAEGSGRRGRCPRRCERHEVVRQGQDGEARGPDLVGVRGLLQAAAGRRAPRAAGGLVGRRRLPHRHQASLLGMHK
jgi:hypothetical protein